MSVPITVTGKTRRGLAVRLSIALAVSAALPENGGDCAVETIPAARVKVSHGLQSLSFEANHGQTDPRAKFLGRGAGYTLCLTASEAILALAGPGNQNSPVTLTMTLVGATPASLSAERELPSKSHYFTDNDPDLWVTDVPHYASVTYREVYSGVDWIHHGAGRRLKHDFVLAPGADPKSIRIKHQGQRELAIDEQGDLVIRTAAGELRQEKPYVFQEVNGRKFPIAGDFVLLTRDEVGFEIGPYDPRRILTIDPVLVYSTYLGGRANFDEALAVAVDSSGSAYITGRTSSPDFPTTPNVVGPDCAERFNCGNSDAFITKFDTMVQHFSTPPS